MQFPLSVPIVLQYSYHVVCWNWSRFTVTLYQTMFTWIIDLLMEGVSWWVGYLTHERLNRYCDTSTAEVMDIVFNFPMQCRQYGSFEDMKKYITHILMLYNIILYVRLPYFHVSNCALFSTYYFSTLILYRRNLDTFYSTKLLPQSFKVCPRISTYRC